MTQQPAGKHVYCKSYVNHRNFTRLLYARCLSCTQTRDCIGGEGLFGLLGFVGLKATGDRHYNYSNMAGPQRQLTVVLLAGGPGGSTAKDILAATAEPPHVESRLAHRKQLLRGAKGCEYVAPGLTGGHIPAQLHVAVDALLLHSAQHVSMLSCIPSHASPVLTC
jgi:hypothetical protein